MAMNDAMNGKMTETHSPKKRAGAAGRGLLAWGALFLLLAQPAMAQQQGYDYQRVYTGTAQSYNTNPSSNYYGYAAPYNNGYGYNNNGPMPGYGNPYTTYNACPPVRPVRHASRAAHRVKAAYHAPPKTLEAKIGDGFHDFFHSRVIRHGVLGGGGGVGLAAITGRNLLRGGLVGAGVGVGVGTMDESYYFKRHPLVRRTGKGALIGVGAAAITSAAALWPAAAVGAGVGAGVHYLKTH